MKRIILNTVYKTKPNYKKFVALVDDEDFERVNKHKWCVVIKKHTNYASANIEGKYTLLHSFIAGSKGRDHINGDGLDNQKHNLRECTHQQNLMNRRGKKESTSRYKGVYFCKQNNKWHSQIMCNTKHIHIGYFLSEIEAALAYNEKARELFGEFAYLNKAI